MTIFSKMLQNLLKLISSKEFFTQFSLNWINKSIKSFRLTFVFSRSCSDAQKNFLKNSIPSFSKNRKSHKVEICGIKQIDVTSMARRKFETPVIFLLTIFWNSACGFRRQFNFKPNTVSPTTSIVNLAQSSLMFTRFSKPKKEKKINS